MKAPIGKLSKEIQRENPELWKQICDLIILEKDPEKRKFQWKGKIYKLTKI